MFIEDSNCFDHYFQYHCIINPIQDGVFRDCSRMGINLMGLIYESEKNLQILMHFPFIEQELLLSKKQFKN